MLDWETDKQEICDIIRGSTSRIKIVLKTKNESEYLERWISHHARIASPRGIIIIDNNSTSDEALEIYKRHAQEILIFRFSGNHNLVHNTAHFHELYEALQTSSDLYAFIDTDEFLYITDGLHHFSGPDAIEHLPPLSSEHSVYFGLWAINLPGNDDIFYIDDISNRLKSSLKGGKPLIPAKLSVRGFVNHNVQLAENNPDVMPTGGALVLHLTMFDLERRKQINKAKILAHGFMKTEAEIDSALDLGDFSAYTGNLRTYLQEIHSILKNPLTRLPDTAQPPRGCARIGDDGFLIFGDPATQGRLTEFVQQCASVWSRCV